MPNLLLLLVQIGVVLIAARAVGALFRRFHQPQVVGEMVAGILLGPSLLGWAAPAISAVWRARCSGEVQSPTSPASASVRPRRSACETPAALSGGSRRPRILPAALSGVSPWRASRIGAAAGFGFGTRAVGATVGTRPRTGSGPSTRSGDDDLRCP